MIAWNLVRFYGTKHATDALRLFTINEDFLVNNSEKNVKHSLTSVLVYFTVKSIKWKDVIKVSGRQLWPLFRYEMVIILQYVTRDL